MMRNNRTANAPEPAVKKSPGLGSYVLWGFVVFLVYVLSSGPVLRWVMAVTPPSYHPGKGWPVRVWNLYAPVWWAYNTTPFHKPLRLYWHIWVPTIFDKSGNFH